MLEKDMYDFWKSIMKLYMMNRQHGRMILESVKNGPLIWPSIEENGVTRPKKYSELSATEEIQADYDVKETNIILQGLPPEERECKLYDKFDNFAYKKGETLLNTKFLNTLSPEWSKFVTDVKLVRDLDTTNVDQLHAYLGQHKFHANEVRLMHEHNSDLLALVATNQMTQSGLIILMFQKGDDPIDAINHMMSFLTDAGRHTSLAAGTSRTYTSGASGNNFRKQRTVICYNYKGEGQMSKQCTKPKRKRGESWFKDKVLLVQAQANVGNKMHKAFPLPGESSHWQYKFPLPLEGVPTARRMEIPLPEVCTAMMKKLPV
nr:hypothetical protein [Tanacetum cinerariifolium]